mmetsp:Transcript_29346/g.45987  ORF Transcript_29346/g.45987 Transcript_29346/m.45987 type:complete len:233 (+) Transcript_29346:60-758(+)
MVVIVKDRLHGALITGDTYDVKGLLKAHGGRWLGDLKGWFFEREAEVLKALVGNQCIIQDERAIRNTRPVPPMSRDRDSSLVVISTPVAARTRARSRTPPVESKSQSSQLPQIRLNERMVRERTVALLEAAGAPQPCARLASSNTEASQEFAEKLARELSEVIEEGARTSYKTVHSRVEQILKSADVLDGLVLASSGLVREVTRMALLKHADATSLRRLGKEYWRLWAARRT